MTFASATTFVCARSLHKAINQGVASGKTAVLSSILMTSAVVWRSTFWLGERGARFGAELEINVGNRTSRSWRSISKELREGNSEGNILVFIYMENARRDAGQGLGSCAKNET